MKVIEVNKSEFKLASYWVFSNPTQTSEKIYAVLDSIDWTGETPSAVFLSFTADEDGGFTPHRFPSIEFDKEGKVLIPLLLNPELEDTAKGVLSNFEREIKQGEDISLGLSAQEFLSEFKKDGV